MISDDEVMRLFEQADPARLPDRANDRVDGTGYLTALRPQRSITMTITESPQTESPTPPRRRWAMAGAAATVTALVIGLVALLARDDEPPGPAAAPPTDLDVAQQFMAAFNDRDLETMQATMGSDADFDGLPVAELPALVAYLEAWDWRWEEATCETSSVGPAVRCEFFDRNRLTDLTGAERPGSAEFTMVDGKIDHVEPGSDLSDYSPNAFEPFRSWVSSNHPEDARKIWDSGGRVVTEETAALLEQVLTEYENQYESEADG